MLTNKSQKTLIREIIECGEQIESNLFNDRFGLCDNSEIRKLRLKMRRRLEALIKQGHKITKIISSNEDFRYSLQFI